MLGVEGGRIACSRLGVGVACDRIWVAGWRFTMAGRAALRFAGMRGFGPLRRNRRGFRDSRRSVDGDGCGFPDWAESWVGVDVDEATIIARGATVLGCAIWLVESR